MRLLALMTDERMNVDFFLAHDRRASGVQVLADESCSQQWGDLVIMLTSLRY